MLPPYIYFTRFRYLPNALEWLVHQIALNLKLVHFKSGKAVVGDSESDLERRGGSGLGVPIYQLWLRNRTYIEVNDPVRVGGLSLGDKDDIVHFSIYFISLAQTKESG